MQLYSLTLQLLDTDGMKIKDSAIHVFRKWYSDIADLRAKHKMVELMQDHAAEYKSEQRI